MKKGLKRLKDDVYGLRFGLLGIAIYYAVVHFLFGQFCPLMILLRFPCPGCGMTRALFLALTGQWKAAWQLQPLVFGWIGLGIWFAFNRYVRERKPALFNVYLVLLLVGTLALYVYRLFCGFPSVLRP